MPMYYPDLASVKRDAEMMAKHSDKSKRYKGLIPQTEKDLPEARKQLGTYFRIVWKDIIQAIEIEQAATKENYDEAISRGIFNR